MQMKFSLMEKKLLRTVTAFALIQLSIVFIFVRMFIVVQPVSISDIKEIDIIVEDVYCLSSLKQKWLVVIADSGKYIFENGTFAECSISELYKFIHKGDKLSLMYRETHSISGKNLVVDARSETATYRTIEEYNRGQQGVPVFVVTLFSLIELVFIGVIVLYIWLNHNTIKGFYRKIKKHLFKKRR